MSQSTINIRVDGDDKKRFEQFCNDTGMNVSVAINMFIKAVLREHKLPFTIQSDMPNTATIAAIEEGEKLMRDPNAKRFKSVDELFAELDS